MKRTRKTEADDVPVIEAAEPIEAPADVVISNPDLCVTVWPGERPRVALVNGSHVQEERHINVTVPEGAEDIAAAITGIVALRVAEIARQHDRQVIRIARSHNGPAIADVLRDDGEFHVVEFS